MCMFHFDDWKRQSKQMGAYLNENATMEEFQAFRADLGRLGDILTEDLYSIFTIKDSFIWFTLFHKFTNSGLDDGRFAEFLKAFKDGLSSMEIDGMVFDTVDKDRSTKEKSVIMDKLGLLETMMCDYLHIGREELEESNILEFVRENVTPDVAKDDIELYGDMLNDFARKVDGSSRLLNQRNRASLIAIIAYACRRDIQMDEWIMGYFNKNDSFLSDQKENYQYMRCDLEDFLKLVDVA